MQRRHNSLFTAAGLSLLAAGALAQSAPTCCKYLWGWPGDWIEEDDPCEGEYAWVCENSSTGAAFGDPFARDSQGYRWAKCRLWHVTGLGYFARGDCSAPPSPYAHIIGILPDGTCCWLEGGELFYIESQGYKVMDCDGTCLESPPQ